MTIQQLNRNNYKLSYSQKELMIENSLLKIKIVDMQKQYLKKRGIKKPNVETILKMRKAISARLKKEMAQIGQIHNSITNKINENPGIITGFQNWQM